MSYRIVEQVIAEQPEHKTKGAALSVLLLLAHRAIDHASPFVKLSIVSIAEACGITGRYAAKVLAKLEEDGQLFINHRGGNGSNYIIPHGFSKEVIAQTMVKMMGLDHYSAMLHAAWLKTGEGERPPVEIRSLRGDVKEKRQQEQETVTTRNDELEDIVGTMNTSSSSARSQKGVDDELEAPDDELLDAQTMPSSSSVKESERLLKEKDIYTAHANGKEVVDPALHALQAAEEIDPDKAVPNDIDLYFGGHRDQFLVIWQEEATEPPKGRERTKIIALAQEDGACPEKWRLSLSEAFDNWTGNGRPSWRRIKDIYAAGGTYAQMTEAKIKSGEWQKSGGSTNGDQRQTSIPGLRREDNEVEKRANIATGETYYVSRATGKRVPAPA